MELFSREGKAASYTESADYDFFRKCILMEIKAVKFRKDGFYSQPFAFGGEEGPEKFDPNIRWRPFLKSMIFPMEKDRAGMSARFADMSMTRMSMTALPLKTCRTTGSARAAGSRSPSSTKHKRRERKHD